MKISHISFGMWFKELDYNPTSRVGDLEKNLSNFKKPFMISDLDLLVNIGLPRIIAQSIDGTTIINMSLVNFNLEKNVGELLDINDAILYINENLQLMYDVFTNIFNLDILYTSIKINILKEEENAIYNLQKNYLRNIDDNMEDLIIKRGTRHNNKYYVNYTTLANKQINYDIKVPDKVRPNDSDMFSRSMLMSLEDASIGKEIRETVIEINDRLSYNNNRQYRVKKEDIRNIIYEFKIVLHDLLKEKE